MLGGAFHDCLGQWYRGRRSSMRKLVKKYQADLEAQALAQSDYYDQEELDKMRMMVDTFSGMMLGYGSLYEKDRDKWDIRRDYIEHKFSVDCGEYDFAGKVDLVVVNGKTDMLVEHKTAARIEDSYIDRLPLDTQIRGYIFGAQSSGLKIGKVLYDIVQKCKLRRKTNESIEQFSDRVALAYESEPDKYFHREPLLFNSSDITAFRVEMQQTHEEYQQIVNGTHELDNLEFRLTNGQPMVRFHAMNPRAWTPEDGHCNAYFRTCEYLLPCTVGLDRGTASIYEQGTDMHEELADED